MSLHMVHRGPDDDGLEVFDAPGFKVGLASRRLAIIDPSPLGHQPMHDPERGTTIAFNGMIYNFAELREELIREGVAFASRCDTEVILKAYGRWGDDCVRRLRGCSRLRSGTRARTGCYWAGIRSGSSRSTTLSKTRACFSPRR